MTIADAAGSLPWHRYPWVWVVVLIPFSAVAFGVVMITTATWYPDDLVVDDYYKEGMAINQQIGMDEFAAAREISAQSSELSDRAVAFQIENVNDAVVLLNLYHVTNSDLDRQIPLASKGGGRYAASAQGQLPFAEKGVWYLELEGGDSPWRLRTRVVTPVATLKMTSRHQGEAE